MSEPQGALKGIAFGLAFSVFIVVLNLLVLALCVITADWLWLILLVTDVMYLIGYIRKRRRSKRGSRATKD